MAHRRTDAVRADGDQAGGDQVDGVHPARRLFRLIEPVHAVTYFHPAARAAHEAVGVRGFWRGYFAMRAAPFGAVGPEVVTAAFFNFHRSSVARALPAVWELISPAEALAVRESGAVDALSEAIGPARGRLGEDIAEAAELLLAAAAQLSVSGRPLFAANTTVNASDDAWGRLFLATTLLREHRGDGHSAAWIGAGLDGVDAHRLRIAIDGFPAGTLLAGRGWSDDEVADCERRLISDGLMAADGSITPLGRTLVDEIEAATDRAAAGATAALEPSGLARIDELLTPIVDRLAADEVIPYPNAVGVDRPT